MGRWLTVAREAEKKLKTPPADTDRTDETVKSWVLSVLSVGKGSVSRNFSAERAPSGPSIHRCECGAIASLGFDWTIEKPQLARWYCAVCAPTAGRA